MSTATLSIIPITQARGQLGVLAERVTDEQYIILTKGGAARAALVDISYLTKLQNDLAKLYQKTYIDPALLPYTREFTDEEIKRWQTEDKLP